jgi:hypothetical protein
MPDSVQTNILYLDRSDLYNEEKPFQVLDDTSDPKFGGNASQTNRVFVPQEVTILNARCSKDRFKMSENGFQFTDIDTKMTSSDFDNDSVVVSTYYPEVEQCIKDVFKEPVEIFVLGHQVSLHFFSSWYR